jgi:hypothetical protein
VTVSQSKQLPEDSQVGLKYVACDCDFNIILWNIFTAMMIYGKQCQALTTWYGFMPQYWHITRGCHKNTLFAHHCSHHPRVLYNASLSSYKITLLLIKLYTVQELIPQTNFLLYQLFCTHLTYKVRNSKLQKKIQFKINGTILSLPQSENFIEFYSYIVEN